MARRQPTYINLFFGGIHRIDEKTRFTENQFAVFVINAVFHRFIHRDPAMHQRITGGLNELDVYRSVHDLG